MRPVPRKATQVRETRQRQVDLPRGAAELVTADPVDEVAGKLLRIDEAREREARVETRSDEGRRDLLAAFERDADGAAILHDHLGHRGVGADRGAEGARTACDRFADRPGPALLKAPRPKRAVDLTHVVVEQHVGRPRRPRAEKRPDDAARRLGRLQGIELEPLVEVVGAAHRHQLVQRVEFFGPEAVEVLAELEHAGQVARRQRRRVRGDHAEDRLHRHRHVVHQLPEDRHGVGIFRCMPSQLLARLVGIGPTGEIVTVVERRDGAFERQDLQAVLRQVEVSDDLGPQQTHHVRENRKLESRKNLFGHGRAPDQWAFFENERLPSRAREVSGRNQAVVPASDDDRVVARAAHAFFRSGSKNGKGCTVASARFL